MSLLQDNNRKTTQKEQAKNRKRAAEERYRANEQRRPNQSKDALMRKKTKKGAEQEQNKSR